MSRSLSKTYSASFTRLARTHFNRTDWQYLLCRACLAVRSLATLPESVRRLLPPAISWKCTVVSLPIPKPSASCTASIGGYSRSPRNLITLLQRKNDEKLAGQFANISLAVDPHAPTDRPPRFLHDDGLSERQIMFPKPSTSMASRTVRSRSLTRCSGVPWRNGLPISSLAAAQSDS